MELIKSSLCACLEDFVAAAPMGIDSEEALDAFRGLSTCCSAIRKITTGSFADDMNLTDHDCAVVKAAKALEDMFLSVVALMGSFAQATPGLDEAVVAISERFEVAMLELADLLGVEGMME